MSGRQWRPGVRGLRVVPACVFAAFLSCPGAVEAQRAGRAVNPAAPEEMPAAEPGLKRDYSVDPVGLRIILPPLDAGTEASTADGSGERRLEIGVHRTLPDPFRGDLAPQLDWVELNDGSIVSSLAVTSPGASAMRMGIRTELPDGGEIRFFGDPGDPEREGSGFPVIGPGDLHLKGESTDIAWPPAVATGASEGVKSSPPSPDARSGLSFVLKGGGSDILWSPVVEGDTLGVEITLPSSEAKPHLSFAIEKISHIHTFNVYSRFEPRRLDCSSHIDVACAAARFPRGQASAVASILFEDEVGTYLCSGTLLNDTVDGTFVPYLLTAHHCVASEGVARSVEVWWFFQRETCGRVEIDDRYAVTHGGAHLLATSVDRDATLLRLRSRPPGGVSFSGWSADPIRHPTAVYGLHHPDGEVMKYSAGVTVNQRNVPVEGLGTLVNAVIVRWERGATEGGSSGSGLFDDLALIGVLAGGTNLCTRGLDVYGPFRDFYPQVKRWLDPFFAHSLPFVTPASQPGRQGFVRIVNNSPRAGTVSIHAIDDEGTRFGPISLSLNAGEGAHFNSRDLEEGNPSKGLFRGVGEGRGNWRLELTTALEIEARAYIRAVDGFLTSIHEVGAEVEQYGDSGTDAVTEDATIRYHVPIFNPGGNESQVSWLRLVNTGDYAVEVVIEARDDDGDPAPWGTVRLTLAAGAARSLSAQQLEQGDAGFHGRLGSGRGKWRLSVSADRPIQVMSLMQSPTGHLTNLSR